MTLPRILKSTEKLEIVRKELETKYNAKVLEQVEYTDGTSGLAQLGVKSFILYESLENNSLHIAKTENLKITLLSHDEFKNMNQSLSEQQQNNLKTICQLLGMTTNNKPKFK